MVSRIVWWIGATFLAGMLHCATLAGFEYFVLPLIGYQRHSMCGGMSAMDRIVVVTTAVLAFGSPVFMGLWIYVIRRMQKRIAPPPPGFCRCGYDLTGNESRRCPECGRPTDQA